MNDIGSRSLGCGGVGAARATLASYRCDELLDIFRAVVVRKLLAGLDIGECFDKNTIPGRDRLAVWLAGVVDVPCEVAARTPFYSPATVYLEEVPSAGFLVGILGGNNVPDIFNIHSRGEQFGRKQAKTGSRSANTKCILGDRVCSSHCDTIQESGPVAKGAAYLICAR